MNRYFFDVVGHGRSELDYTGRLLPSPERAYDAAELMAFDLVVRWEGTIGWAVNVSNSVDAVWWGGAKTFLDPGASILSSRCANGGVTTSAN